MSHPADENLGSYLSFCSITFVNGRTRGQIVDEMEERLGLENGEEASREPFDQASEEWEKELTRAINDIGLIAQDRANKLSWP